MDIFILYIQLEVHLWLFVMSSSNLFLRKILSSSLGNVMATYGLPTIDFLPFFLLVQWPYLGYIFTLMFAE